MSTILRSKRKFSQWGSSSGTRSPRSSGSILAKAQLSDAVYVYVRVLKIITLAVTIGICTKNEGGLKEWSY